MFTQAIPHKMENLNSKGNFDSSIIDMILKGQKKEIFSKILWISKKISS